VKRHLIVGATVLGVFVVFVRAGIPAVSYIGWWTLPLGVAVVAGAWLGGRCWHRDVSLLPPVHGAGPERAFARWHCNGCEATWAANLESATRPRTMYAGYDPAKAQQAAARADTLERERRRLAIERAGLSKSPKRPIAVEAAGSPALARVAGGGRLRRLSVDAPAPNLDEGRLANRRSSDNLPRIRPLRG
jgi:hypothetical protein